MRGRTHEGHVSDHYYRTTGLTSQVWKHLRLLHTRTGNWAFRGHGWVLVKPPVLRSLQGRAAVDHAMCGLEVVRRGDVGRIKEAIMPCKEASTRQTNRNQPRTKCYSDPIMYE